ncbi:hypothetical protein PsorP6_001801 [Peronosclerospora sorghi]|uniref:Uncharacterized protein n=1 Tax=Peronosclerospora sorghi TaxID=230839 RepID=A0ACC0WUH8_9STRA|nr:hypothetical protein PsorP6_001801 [Peronosclerospora sorghi]
MTSSRIANINVSMRKGTLDTGRRCQVARISGRREEKLGTSCVSHSRPNVSPSSAGSAGVITSIQTLTRGTCSICYGGIATNGNNPHELGDASFACGYRSYTEDEDKIIVEMQAKLGNRWSIIAQQLKGRTEDAVKIRWKSLMRGRRAASKEDKQPSSGTTSSASSITTSSAPLTTDIEQQKVKFSKASPARVNTQTAAPEASSVSGLKNEMVRTKKGAVDATSTSKSMSYMPDTVFVKSSQALAPASRPDLVTAMNGSNPMHMNDLVAASIHNFQMSQRFRSSSSSHTSTTMYPGNPNQVILPVNQQHSAIYAMPDGAMGTYNMNTLPLMQQHQQLPPSFQYSPGFTMPQNMGGMPNYVVPTNFAASNLMQMPMQLSMAMPPLPSTPSFSSQTMALAMPNAPYQQQSATLHSGFSGAPLHPRGSPQPTIHQTSNGFAASSNSSTTGGVNGSGTSPASLPPSSAAAASGGGKGLNTPREEWGSSQTPRSRMIMTEGHASAYELFHQQRLRLMLQERDKQGLSLSSAPSPGQALLTKELEANKERQARQAIMQKGWKSAVDSMSFSSVSDLSTLDEQQRFDGLLEKVSLSALDPTDDELLEQSVDIISGGMYACDSLRYPKIKA